MNENNENILENEFLNILGENESTLADETILGADIGDGEGGECDGDDRACVCDPKNICGSDACKGMCDSDGCTCVSNNPTTVYYAYTIAYTNSIYGYYRSDDNADFRNYFGITILTANTASLSASNSSNNSFIQSISGSILSKLAANPNGTYLSGRTTSQIYNYASYSANPFCWAKGLTITKTGHREVYNSIPFYIKVNTGTSSTISAPNFVPPVNSMPFTENYYLIRAKNAIVENEYLQGAIITLNSAFVNYFPYTNTNEIRTGNIGCVRLYSSAGTAYIAGTISRIGFENNGAIPFTAYTNTETIVDLRPNDYIDGCPIPFLRGDDVSKISPDCWVSNNINPNLNLTTNLLNSSGVTINTGTLLSDGVIQTPSVKAIYPSMNQIIDDGLYGKGHYYFGYFDASHTINTTDSNIINNISIPGTSRVVFVIPINVFGTGSVTLYIRAKLHSNSSYTTLATKTINNSVTEIVFDYNYYLLTGGYPPNNNVTYGIDFALRKASTSNPPTITISGYAPFIRKQVGSISTGGGTT